MTIKKGKRTPSIFLVIILVIVTILGFFYAVNYIEENDYREARSIMGGNFISPKDVESVLKDERGRPWFNVTYLWGEKRILRRNLPSKEVLNSLAARGFVLMPGPPITTPDGLGIFRNQRSISDIIDLVGYYRWTIPCHSIEDDRFRLHEIDFMFKEEQWGNTDGCCWYAFGEEDVSILSSRSIPFVSTLWWASNIYYSLRGKLLFSRARALAFSSFYGEVTDELTIEECYFSRDGDMWIGPQEPYWWSKYHSPGVGKEPAKTTEVKFP